jgi:hypothetical protein
MEIDQGDIGADPDTNVWMAFVEALERSRDQQVAGIVRGSTISWQLGRKRGMGVG